jgi:chemotaxis protein methyltransferase CheR
VTVTLAASEVERFRTFLSDRLGLQFEDGKLGDLAEYLRRRIASTGLRSFDAYLARLADADTFPAELRAIGDQLTVGETYFFRNPNHFRAVREQVLARAPGRERPLRILSAGCASGEEAYTLAILVREVLGAAEAARVRILGIDINPTMLDRARRGRYTPWSLRATPLEAQERWFRAANGHFELDEAVRSAVTFEERNLMQEDPAFWGPGAFDLIFCRNVLIYFSPEAVRAAVARFAGALAPGGHLFLGDAENLRAHSHDFHLHHTHDTFYYQVRDPAEPRRPAPPLPPRTASAAPDLPPLVDPDASWVSAIHGAAERIERLGHASRDPGPAGRAAAVVAPAVAWDLAGAHRLLQEERYAEAHATLATLPAEAGQDPDVQLMRASILASLGDVPGAAEACRAVLALDELSAGAHYLLALCEEHRGDLDSAVQHDQTALYLDPGFAMPRLHLGRLAKRRGDRETARGELLRALDLLAREDVSRIVLFGGGFRRETLLQVCRAELLACGGPP